MSNLNDYENDFLSQIYNQESSDYKVAIDSLMDEKKDIWELFNKSVDQKTLAKKITKASIKYNYYNSNITIPTGTGTVLYYRLFGQNKIVHG